MLTQAFFTGLSWDLIRALTGWPPMALLIEGCPHHAILISASGDHVLWSFTKIDAYIVTDHVAPTQEFGYHF